MAVPTVLRLLFSTHVAQLPFVAYIPFIIGAAVVLDKRYAAGTSFASWLVADLMFMRPELQMALRPDEIIGFIVFMSSSALIIVVAEASRTIVENSLRPVKTSGFSAPVVFSLEGGQAWVSWYGSHSRVRLGPEDDVAEMMEDFLAQRELGKRLARHQPADLSEGVEPDTEKMAPRA